MSDRSCKFDVRHGPRLAARSYLTLHNDRVEISDLIVFQKVPLPDRFWWFRSMFGLKSPSINYRRLGLGSALIESIFEFARKHGRATITGRVVENDIRQTPELLSWYRKRGFSIQNGGTSISATVSVG